ncbi:PAS domain S-box protein [Natronomonas salina]|uniref:PAS domain S-box protein n=1 Tax=Natronomonas salina TaxID=1710540 RepID=UPI0015B73DC0|nr:PAS domain S-box protein [Natronomonas salina]QLD90151.1 PAS domain S-box protein [Natronomonas salina]
MSATSHEWDGAGAAGAETAGERLQGWSVAAVGVALTALPLVGTTGADAFFTVPEAVPPLLVALGIAVVGGALRRSAFTPADVAIIAGWVAVTALGLGFVVGLAALVLSDDPVSVGLYVTSFVAPIGAGGGVVAGYTDARRRRQYRQTKRTQRALETSTDGITILDEDGEYVTVNRAHAEVYGYDDPEELVGEPWQICYDDAERKRLETEIMPGVEAGEPWRGEATGKRADGTTFPQELTLTPMDDGGHVCIVRDIGDRREQDRKLREQKRRLRSIIENVPIILFSVDDTGEIVLSEGKGLSSMGFEPGEAVGSSIFDIYADVPAVAAATRRALDGEHVHETATLGDRVLEAWFTPVYDDAGEVDRVIGTAMDVTDRHEREQELAELHEASRRLNYATTPEEVAQTTVDIAEEVFDMPVSTLWRYDPADDCLRHVAMTDSSEAILGVDAVDELAPITADELGMEVFREGELRVVEVYRTVANRALDVPFGTVILVPLGGQGLLEVGQREVRTVSEETRRRADILGLNAQAALDRADQQALLRERTRELEVRTSQMDFINSIIRHDVLNGMTVIRSRAAFLQEDLEGRHAEFADTIVRWCDNIVAFVERVQTVLDTLGGDDVVDLERIDAAELVDGELERLRQTYPEVTFEDDLRGPVYVRADELLADVVGNIVTNAVEHNDTEGLRIAVTAAVDGDRTTIRIADNGTGVPPDQREAIFRRGESHAKSTGSGFGLFFVDAMVEAYGGEVWVEGDDGAVFVVELPTAAAPKRDAA